MTKVAIIIERADIELGGAERSVSELCEALQNIGLDAHIVAAKANPKSNRENIHSLCQDITGKRVPYSVFEDKLKNYFAENKFDIIHSVLPFDFADVYQPRGGTYAESIIRNTASYKCPVMRTFKKFTSAFNFRRTQLLKAERRLCSRPNGPVIAALSNYVAEQFKKHYKVNPDRIAVIHNGVKTVNQIDNNAVESLREKLWSQFSLKKENKPLLLLFAANNFRLKGLQTLIKAIQLLFKKTKDSPVYLVVAGNGNKTKYSSLAKKLGVDNRIFFSGPVENIQHLLALCDAAVLPTFYDPSSRVVLEALAKGKPAITTTFNGAAEQFENKRHGFIINNPNNQKQLAEAIQFFTQKQNINDFSNNIINDNIKEKVSISRAAQQLKKLYTKIQSKKK